MEKPHTIDWRKLRLALGMTQEEMARIIAVTLRHYCRLERSPQIRATQGVLVMLRSQLQRPELRKRLEVAGYANPFDERQDE